MSRTWTVDDRGMPRDYWKRPGIRPVDGGDLKPYTRASSLGSALDDTSMLEAWKRRMTAVGLAKRRDLILQVNRCDPTKREHKGRLDSIVDRAMEFAGAGERASIGTSMHDYAEAVDRGEDPGYVPPEFERDLDAYLALTQPLFEHVAIEQFCVCDELEVAGTPDRVSRLKVDLVAPDRTRIPAGSVLVTDEKTSGSMDFGGVKFATQLAVYSRGQAYDPETGRTPWPDGIRQDWGLIVHCPAGEGTAQLVWVDLTAGWELAQLAVKVRAARKRKRLLVPIAPEPEQGVA